MPLAKFASGCLLTVLAFACPSVAFAADAHPRVIGFERFHSGEKRDVVVGGQLLLGELNCTSCHAADKSLDTYVQKKQAPVLDTVGSRVRPNYLLKYTVMLFTVAPLDERTVSRSLFARLPFGNKNFFPATGLFIKSNANCSAEKCEGISSV